MGQLITNVLPLVLGAAVSPTVLIVNLLVLCSPQHARARSAAYTVGATLALCGLGVVALLVMHPASSSKGAHNPVLAWLDLVAGCLLLAFGLRAFLTRKTPPRPREMKAESGRALGRYFGLGVVMMATNVTSLVLFVPAVKEVVVADVPAWDKVIVAVVGVGIITFVAWAPLAASVLFRDRADEVLGRLNSFVGKHQKVIAGAVGFAFGVYLAVKGLREI